jgi:hypothetical protein
MGRYSTRDDKPGKKAWIWGLSRQGMIWEKLLTDADGQYVEVQSGRSFNQAAEESTFTPFKHRGFEPHAFDAWTEYWFPVKGTKGFVAANEYGALNDLSRAELYARRALDLQPEQARTSSDAFRLSLVVSRLRADPERRPAKEASDPLAHMERFERHLLDRNEASRRAFVSGIRNEMPHETFLELASWYAGAGRLAEARAVLELAPPQAEVLYWLAYLAARSDGGAGSPTGKSDDLAPGSASALLQRAESASPRMVFPFRSESAEVFEWAMRKKSRGCGRAPGRLAGRAVPRAGWAARRRGRAARPRGEVQGAPRFHLRLAGNGRDGRRDAHPRGLEVVRTSYQPTGAVVSANFFRPVF